MTSNTNPKATFDSEVYRNFTLFKFKRIDTGAIREFRQHEGMPLNRRGLLNTLKGCTIISFNGINYDHPIVSYALAGATCEQIKELSDAIIVGGMKPWEAERHFGFKLVSIDHIDLIEIMPGINSLKVYGGKMHCRKLQDLPIEHDQLIAPEQREPLASYCENDLDTTAAGFFKFQKQIELREKMSLEYGVDLRSKSDAQIAEAVIKAKVGTLLGMKVGKPDNVPRAFRYKPPAWMRFRTKYMQDIFETICNTTFALSDAGKVVMPDVIKALKIKIGNSTYQMGIGGLHSTEANVCHVADSMTMIIDRDVASYYPAIIINTGLYPQHLGRHFLHVYRDIRDKRIEAKRLKNKTVAETLKIVLNGSFGKFGNRYSTIYAPDLMIQVTVGGQLALLMLIEMLELEGFNVISANTDGIVTKVHRRHYDQFEGVIKLWESDTGFETEETRYAALYSSSVNSYLALKEDGHWKLKGDFAEPEPVASSWPSPHGQVCVEAVCNFLQWGIPLDSTIRACDDIRQFVHVRNVTGGGTWNGQYLGKAVRWIYSNDPSATTIHYKKANKTGHFNKVPETDGCRPLMELPDLLPPDLDLERYIAEAEKILRNVGYKESQ